MSDSLGLYLHVPFCRTRCRYCDFYRVGENRARMERFVTALTAEIDGLDAWHGSPVDTVFFGGGTPSLLEPERVAGLLERIAAVFAVAPDAEISLEGNPSDLDADRLRGYREAGVNRLSIGVQSFVDRELALLGRRHSARRAVECFAAARRAGFDNISIDLMLGIPGQTRAGFERTLDTGLALGSEHLSAYLLEVHERSEMDVLRRRRPRLFPDEEAQRRRYLRLAERAETAGLEQYEISNFARPGRAARHNLRYWRCEPYLGLGPAAHSAAGARRWRHPPDLDAYLDDPLAVEPVPVAAPVERLMMGLRLAEGVEPAVLGAALGVRADEVDCVVRELSPYLERRGAGIALSREGFLVSNAVLTELLWRAPASQDGGRRAVGPTTRRTT